MKELVPAQLPSLQAPAAVLTSSHGCGPTNSCHAATLRRTLWKQSQSICNLQSLEKQVSLGSAPQGKSSACLSCSPPALEVGGRWVQAAPAASQCSKPHSPWSLQMPQHITRVYLFIYLRSWELWQKPRVPAEAGSSGSTVSLSSQHVAVRAKGWLESAHGACIANWVLNFSENLGLNVDSLILLGFGICFKILCGSQKLRDYCQCTKQMDSTRFHPFGSRQIMPLE